MASNNLAGKPRVSLAEMIIFISIFGVIGTFITYWIGLSVYPIPIILFIITIIIAISKGTDDQFSWKQLASIFGVAAIVSTATASFISRPDPDQNEIVAPTPSPPAVAQELETRPSPIVKSQRRTSSARKAPIETSIDELLSAYADNQVAASRKFGSAPVKLTGKVIRVSETLGTGFLTLKSTTSRQTHEFGFSEAGTDKLETLGPGDIVSITCPTVIEALSLVAVVDCSDVEIL